MTQLELVTDLDFTGMIERLEIAEGVCASGDLVDIDLTFDSETFAPVQRWRRAVADDFIDPFGDRPIYKYWSTLGLFRAPQTFTAELERIDAEGQDSPNGHDLDYAIERQSRIDAVARAFDDWTDFIRFGPILGMAVNRQAGGEYLSTPDSYDERIKTGLHVDSWDHKPWSERRGGSNRISINIGSFPRHLVFSVIPVAEISRVFERKRRHANFSFGLIPEFLLARPGTRMYRLRVEPGEAYVAPTENIIHDGSTLLVDGEDAQVVVRGFFAHYAMINDAQFSGCRLRPALKDVV